MKVRDTFAVDAPASEVYAALLDLKRVAPCVPGVEGIERVGEDAYTASMRIKVGPITMRYKADIEIVEKDPDAYRARMQVRAKESRGQGSAQALADLTITQNGDGSHGAVDVDVKLSGRVASMGQGAIQDVSSRIVSAFAENLGAMLGGAGAGAGAGAAPEPAPGAEAAATPPSPTSPPPTPAPAAEPIDAGALAGAVVTDQLRSHRVAIAVAVAAFFAGLLAGRRW